MRCDSFDLLNCVITLSFYQESFLVVICDHVMKNQDSVYRHFTAVYWFNLN